jgi:hypothetical protein
VVFGCSFLFTAAGQSRIFTGFPLDVSPETSPASDTQHKVYPFGCQPKYCASVKNQRIFCKENIPSGNPGFLLGRVFRPVFVLCSKK